MTQTKLAFNQTLSNMVSIVDRGAVAGSVWKKFSDNTTANTPV